jgi:hypothetical protein
MAAVQQQDIAPMIDKVLEGADLTVAHTMLALVGFFLSVYVMQLTHWEAEDDVDPPAIRLVRRAVHAVLAWSMLWSLSYSQSKGWQPWPAELMMMVAIDVILIIRVVAIKARIRRAGIKPDAPRAQVSAPHKLTIMR